MQRPLTLEEEAAFAQLVEDLEKPKAEPRPSWIRTAALVVALCLGVVGMISMVNNTTIAFGCVLVIAAAGYRLLIDHAPRLKHVGPWATE